MTKKLSTYEVVTNALVDAMEGTDGKGFVCPWTKTGSGFPKNGATGRTYNGINILILWAAQMGNGFGSNEWMTFKQARDLKGQVRKGSKGTRVVFWHFPKTSYTVVEEEDGKEVTRLKEKSFPMCKTFVVFNRDQIEGLPEKEAVVVNEEERKAALEAFITNTTAHVTHGGDSAHYNVTKDTIRLPLYEQFKSADAYYSIAFHELGHWTGSETRLNRDLTGRFGSEAYAMEELVAELTSAFLCADHGLNNELQHAEYLANWIQVMKNDPYAIFTAAREATKAAKFLKGDIDTDNAEEGVTVEATA